MRAAEIVRTAGGHALHAGRSLRDSIAEYLLDEKPQLVRRGVLDEFNAELARTRDALARVEKRIERLDQQTLARQAAACAACGSPRAPLCVYCVSSRFSTPSCASASTK